LGPVPTQPESSVDRAAMDMSKVGLFMAKEKKAGVEGIAALDVNGGSRGSRRQNHRDNHSYN
jgi:hypothetical protein